MSQKIDLYLGGVRAVLSLESEICISYAVNSFQDVKSRQGALSNDYTLPLDAVNDVIFQNANQLNSATTKPYVKIPARIECDGVPQLVGYCQLKNTSEQGYQVTIFGDNADWFLLLEGKKLTDLDLSDYDHDWTFANVIASASNTIEQGYKYLAVDYGKFKNRLLDSGCEYGELLPWVYRKILLEKIFSDIGYTLKGNILDVPEFAQSMIGPSRNPMIHSQAWVDDRIGIIDAASVNQASVWLYFPTVTQATEYVTYENESFVDGTFRTNMLVERNVRMKFRIQLTVLLAEINYARTLIMAVLKSHPTTTEENYHEYEKKIFVRAGVESVEIDYETDVFDILPGEKIIFQMAEPKHVFWGRVYSGSVTLTRDTTILPGEQVNLAANLPDMSQQDFVRTIFNQFEVIQQTKRKTVRLDALTTIDVNRPQSRNWSKKIDWKSKPKPEMEFNYSAYGKKSWLKYKADSSDVLLKEEPDYGNAFLEVANEFLPAEKTLFESVFAATKSSPSFQAAVTLPFVPFFEEREDSRYSIWSAGDTYFHEPIQDYTVMLGRYFRALVDNIGPDKPPLYLEGTWKVNTGEWVEGSVSQFAAKKIFNDLKPVPRVLVLDPLNDTVVRILQPDTIDTYVDYVCNASFDLLTFEALLLKFYPPLQGILNKLHFVKLNMMLDAIDIGMLDFVIPIYLSVTTTRDDDLHGYFYLNQILQMKPGSGEPCEVELLRLAPQKDGVYVPMVDYAEQDYNDKDYQ